MAESRFIVFVNVTQEIGEKGNPKPADLSVDKLSFTVYGDTEDEAVKDALAHIQHYSSRVAAKTRVTESGPWDFTKKVRIREGLKYMGLATTWAIQLVDEFEAAVADQKLELPVEKLIPMVWGWHMHAANERRKADEKVFSQAQDDATGALRAQDQAEIQERDEMDTDPGLIPPYAHPSSVRFGRLPLRTPPPKTQIPESIIEQLDSDDPDKRTVLAQSDLTVPIPTLPATEQGPDVTIDGTKGYSPTGNWPPYPFAPDDEPTPKEKKEDEPLTGG